MPFVGCHGGKLIDKPADEYLQSADLLVDGLRKARELYRPDGLPVVFDLQVEAEILGCDLQWATDVPPAVTSHPLSNMSLEELPPYDLSKGRMPLILEALDRLHADLGANVAFYGLVCGPFTLALHLMGNDIFLEMFDEPDQVKPVIDYAGGELDMRPAKGKPDLGVVVIARGSAKQHVRDWIDQFAKNG